jgi:hypothetical protein
MTDSSARLKDKELELRKHRDRYARASLVIEGLDPTPEEDALFAMFARERLSDDECLRILREHRQRARDFGRDR